MSVVSKVSVILAELAGNQRYLIDEQLEAAADVVCVLPGVSPKLKNRGMDITSVQPMGSAFEQMTFLVFDALVLELMERTEQTSDDMF